MEKNTKRTLPLLNDTKVVERVKTWFIIPAIVLVVAILMGTVWGFVKGAPLNLSIDFTGGYTMTVNLGTRLTDENEDDYKREIEEIAKNLADDEGNVYGLKIDRMQRQGIEDPTKSAILIRYKAIKSDGADDENAFMNEVNDRFKEELDKFFSYLPHVTVSGSTIVADYDAVLPDFNQSPLPFASILRTQAAEYGVTLDSFAVSGEGRILTIGFTGTTTAEDAEKFLTVSSVFSGKTSDNESTSPLVGTELLWDAICAVLLALTLMLVYIAFRFEGSSGFVAVLALFHDIIIMLAFMVIFHVEIGSTFIAALITILGYSITNTIILFDRVREKLRPYAGKAYIPNVVANESVRDVYKRALITTATTLIPITVIAMVGVESIQIFAFPIIVGLLAGTFSTVFLAPSMWAMWKNYLVSRSPAGAVIAPAPRVRKPRAEKAPVEAISSDDSAPEQTYDDSDAALLEDFDEDDAALLEDFDDEDESDEESDEESDNETDEDETDEIDEESDEESENETEDESSEEAQEDNE